MAPQQPQYSRSRPWGCRQRFLSPGHFRSNAWTLLALAVALVTAEAAQFLVCYCGGLPCLSMYGRPAAAALRALALPMSPALMAPGCLCLLAATRSPRLLRPAMWSCLLGLPAVGCLLTAIVGEAADYAGERAANPAASAAVANLAGLTLCVTLACLMLVFLAMQACVAARLRLRQGRAAEQDETVDDEDEDAQEVEDIGLRLARCQATSL